MSRVAIDIVPAADVVPQLPQYQPGPQVDLGPRQPVPVQPSPVRRRPAPRSSVTVAIVVGALAVSGWFGFGHAGKHDLSGDLTLIGQTSSTYLSIGDSCSGDNGYDDLTAGAEMTVTNSAGDTLATSTLSDGVYDGASCVFSFSFKDVPSADEYTIDLADSIRTGQTFSRSEMSDDGWKVHLSLGD